MAAFQISQAWTPHVIVLDIVATAREGSLPAVAITTARIGAASAEFGPSTRIRLGPKTAYASNGTIVA
jgi:hypothetical protein